MDGHRLVRRTLRKAGETRGTKGHSTPIGKPEPTASYGASRSGSLQEAPQLRSVPRMTSADSLSPHQNLRLPDWVQVTRQTGLEEACFGAGAALSLLDLAQQDTGLPQPLWRARLALEAAEHAARLTGRQESRAQMRDEVHLLRPGETPGPAGAIALAWLRAVERPVLAANLHRALPTLSATQLETWAAPSKQNPIMQAAQIAQAVMADLPRGETTALILADAALARALGWRHVVPLLGLGLSRRDLRPGAEDLPLACAQAIIRNSRTALAMASDLARRAGMLQAIQRKLRARGADQALALFLTRDALAPSRALVPLMSDRAARRFCDRLVELGAVQELTGRDTFRLYGL